VACPWKWRITSSLKSGPQKTKKHHRLSPHQIFPIALSALRTLKSREKNCLPPLASLPLLMNPDGEKRLVFKRRLCINSNNKNKNNKDSRKRLGMMHICKLNKRRDNMPRWQLNPLQEPSIGNNNLLSHRNNLSLQQKWKRSSVLDGMTCALVSLLVLRVLLRPLP